MEGVHKCLLLVFKMYICTFLCISLTINKIYTENIVSLGKLLQKTGYLAIIVMKERLEQMIRIYTWLYFSSLVKFSKMSYA